MAAHELTLPSAAATARAIAAKQVSPVEVVQAYLDRIDAYDQRGPTLNAVQNVNPEAQQRAAELDASFQTSGEFGGPLHCIPVLVKDQVNTNFMPTTYGSALFEDFVPSENATIIERMQASMLE